MVVSLSLCSGGAGLDLGLELALGDVQPVAYVEREASAVSYLAQAIEKGCLPAAPIWTDLRTFNPKPFAGLVDCVVGSPPCQSFSITGKRKGKDDPRHLWPHFNRIISKVKPAFVFLENVPGYLAAFDEVAPDLERVGFKIAAGLFGAEEAGSPHGRERLFALAVADAQRVEALLQRGGPKRFSKQIGRASSTGRKGARPAKEQADSNGLDRCDPDLAAFPPGPGESWRQVAPGFEPGIHGMADGVADRLRLLGNGVVPLQAAYAFLSLWASMQGN